MRLFTGLDLPSHLVASLDDLVRRLRPLARINWSPPVNLHITTKFIGELPDERLNELKAGLGALPSRPPLEVAIRNVGFFPNPHSPRIFWCGIQAEGLPELASDTDQACAALGIPKETKPYSPHLTLARIKDRVELQPLREALAAMDSQEFGQFQADRFYLYRSVLKPTGSVYTKLAEFPLTNA